MTATLTGERRRYIHTHAQVPAAKRYFGLDLGHRQDHSALAVLELQWTHVGRCPLTFAFLFEPNLHIRGLASFPVGTSYDALYGLLDDAIPHHGDQQLVVDAGGPGIPVVERIRSGFGKRTQVRAVMITGGVASNTLTGGFSSVPRRALIANIQLLLAARSIQCVQGLPGAERLKQELLGLAAGSSQPVASAAHDDLAIAASLAAWQAVQDAPELLPESEETSKDRKPRSLYGGVRLF